MLSARTHRQSPYSGAVETPLTRYFWVVVSGRHPCHAPRSFRRTRIVRQLGIVPTIQPYPTVLHQASHQLELSPMPNSAIGVPLPALASQPVGSDLTMLPERIGKNWARSVSTVTNTVTTIRC